MDLRVPQPDLCSEGDGLIGIEAACDRAARRAIPIGDVETVPLERIPAAARSPSPCRPPSRCRPSTRRRWTATRWRSADAWCRPATRIRFLGRIAAGDAAPALPAGHAAHIFTLAPLPAGPTAVLMQEHGRRDGGRARPLPHVEAGGQHPPARARDIREDPLLVSGNTPRRAARGCPRRPGPKRREGAAAAPGWRGLDRGRTPPAGDSACGVVHLRLEPSDALDARRRGRPGGDRRLSPTIRTSSPGHCGTSPPAATTS